MVTSLLFSLYFICCWFLPFLLPKLKRSYVCLKLSPLVRNLDPNGSSNLKRYWSLGMSRRLVFNFIDFPYWKTFSNFRRVGTENLFQSFKGPMFLPASDTSLNRKIMLKSSLLNFQALNSYCGLTRTKGSMFSISFSLSDRTFTHEKG